MANLNEIVQQNSLTKDSGLIEYVWVPYATEEIPNRAFNQWYIRSFPASASNRELKSQGSKVEDRIYTVYNGMIEIGGEIIKAEK